MRSTKMLTPVLVVWSLLCLVLFAASQTGCAAAPDNGEPAWPPAVEVSEAKLKGELVLSTQAGPVTVDLETAYLAGDGAEAVSVESLTIEAELGVEVEGIGTQELTLVSTGKRFGEAWAQCLDAYARLRYGVIGLGLHAVPPGLPEACGAALVEVLPLAAWAEPSPVPLQ